MGFNFLMYLKKLVSTLIANTYTFVGTRNIRLGIRITNTFYGLEQIGSAHTRYLFSLYLLYDVLISYNIQDDSAVEP